MSPNGTRLAGRTALVTGSTGGLGVAIASALAAEGAFVVVSGRDKERGDAVVAGIQRGGWRAEFVAADIGAGEAEVRRLAEQATSAAGGRIDILVNNAAMLLMPTPTADVSEQRCRRRSTSTCSRRSCSPDSSPPRWRNAARAPSSTSARSPACAGRRLGGLRRHQGGVCTRSPDPGRPNSGRRASGSTPSRRGRSPPKVSGIRRARGAVLGRSMPSRRMSTPAEVAAAVAFLASDDAANIHGAVLSVDGGWAAV